MEVLNNYLANSVDLYGGGGGGGTTNYNELSNKPYFCNVLLQGNIILTQVINSPDDTIIIGANSIQVNKQLFYTKTQVDSLVAGISATYITATLPANPSANTYYLVGNDNDGYVLYYYDSNLTEAKVGNYTLDVDEFLKKTDVTITINGSSTNLQVPSAKSVYDNLITKINNFSYDTEKTRQELFEASVIGSNSFSVTFTTAESPTGSNSARFVVFVNKNNSTRGSMIAQQINVTGDTQGDIWTCFLNNSGWSNWQFALQNRYAPIQSSITLNNFTAEAADAVWNLTDRLPTEAYRRYIEKRMFFGAVVDPITNTKIYGDMEVTIGCYLAGSDNGTIIKQKIDCSYSSQDARKVFFRIGTLDKSYGVAVKDNKDKIEWKDWIPLEYPQITIPTTSLNASVVTYGNISYKITGGVLVINLNYLKFATASQNGQVITGNSNFSWISPAIAKLNCQCVIHGWKTTNIPTSGFATISVSSKNITVYDVQANNKEYYGQLIVPLGY